MEDLLPKEPIKTTITTHPRHPIRVHVVSVEDLELALCELERSPAVVIQCGEDSTGPEQEGDHGDVGGAGCQVEGRVTQPVSEVWISTVF